MQVLIRNQVKRCNLFTVYFFSFVIISHNMKSIQKTIGQIIRDERKKQNISQSDLAGLSNIERSNISKLESGNHNMTIATFERISEGLRVPMSTLMRRMEKIRFK